MERKDDIQATVEKTRIPFQDITNRKSKKVSQINFYSDFEDPYMLDCFDVVQETYYLEIIKEHDYFLNLPEVGVDTIP